MLNGGSSMQSRLPVSLPDTQYFSIATEYKGSYNDVRYRVEFVTPGLAVAELAH